MSEYNTLNNEEKMQVLRSQIKNLQYSKYNLELSVLMEQSLDEPSQASIDGYNKQILDIQKKELVLEGELNRLASTTEG